MDDYPDALVQKLHLKRVYFPHSATVVCLQLVRGRIGYLDCSDALRARWVWLTSDEILSLEPYSGPPTSGLSYAPDLELNRPFSRVPERLHSGGLLQ
jgi:hypothetical protein